MYTAFLPSLAWQEAWSTETLSRQSSPGPVFPLSERCNAPILSGLVSHLGKSQPKWLVFWVQVQRWWVNFDGVATAKHFALQVAAMEELRKGTA